MPWDIIGHNLTVDLLRRDLAHDRLRHAYLFTGPAGVGKRTLAQTFARALLCEDAEPPCGECRNCRLAARNAHPDLFTITPVVSGARVKSEKIKIDVVRQLLYDLALKPVEARRRVACLWRFDAANVEAMNSLLKTLEEPPASVSLLLTADSADDLLPTIVSRCEVLALRPLPLETVRAALIERWLLPADRAELLAHLAGGRLGWAVRMQADDDAWEERIEKLADLRRLLSASRVERFAYAEKMVSGGAQDRQQATLSLWAEYWRDILLTAAGAATPLTHIDRSPEIQALAGQLEPTAIRAVLSNLLATADLLARNTNARLALEVMLMDWPHLAA